MAEKSVSSLLVSGLSAKSHIGADFRCFVRLCRMTKMPRPEQLQSNEKTAEYVLV